METTIKQLTEKYGIKTEKVVKQMAAAEEQQALTKQPCVLPRIAVPNFALEVIAPVVEMLRKALPEYDIPIPSGRKKLPISDYYRLIIGIACIGGFSCPFRGDYDLYFTPMFKQKPMGEKLKIENMAQLVEVVKAELNKRGLLILPEHLE